MTDAEHLHAAIWVPVVRGSAPVEAPTSQAASVGIAVPDPGAELKSGGDNMPAQTYRKANQVPSFARVHREAASR